MTQPRTANCFLCRENRPVTDTWRVRPALEGLYTFCSQTCADKWDETQKYPPIAVGQIWQGLQEPNYQMQVLAPVENMNRIITEGHWLFLVMGIPTLFVSDTEFIYGHYALKK